MGKDEDLSKKYYSQTDYDIKVNRMVLLVLFLILIPVWFLSMRVVSTFFKMVNQPVMAGQIPMWVVIVLVVLVVLYVRNRRRSQAPPNPFNF